MNQPHENKMKEIVFKSTPIPRNQDLVCINSNSHNMHNTQIHKLMKVNKLHTLLPTNTNMKTKINEN